MSETLTVLIRAVDGVVTFVLIGCLGYFLAKRHWFSDDSVGLLSKLITFVAIPAYLVHNITVSFDREELLSLAAGVIPPFLSIAFAMAISWGLAKLIKSRAPGLFTVGFSCGNSINIGLPINLALFGPEGVPFVLLYFMANTILFWSIGNYLIASDSVEPRVTPGLTSNLGKILSPPMLAFVVGVAVVMTQIPVPHVVAHSLELVGSMNAGLVMISLGVTLHRMGFASLKWDREMALIVAGRFVVSPLILILLSFIFPMPTLMRNVFIIQASMPVMTNSAIQAIYYDANVDYATRSVCLTTVLSIFTIPIFMVLAQALGA
ncbi:MAG: AEC family transporter [Planctomycetaceae bacterium]|nr:AEC family transporter [Planctomycetaceae bacterium]